MQPFLEQLRHASESNKQLLLPAAHWSEAIGWELAEAYNAVRQNGLDFFSI